MNYRTGIALTFTKKAVSAIALAATTPFRLGFRSSSGRKG